ncbi:MAG: metallophosphoesterase [Halobacteriaceae archaeon]
MARTRARVEPLLGEPAATAALPDGDALVVSDYHAGIEASLRREGVEVASHAAERRDRLLAALAETDADRLVVLGDLADSVGPPGDAEREELRDLVASVAVPVTLVRGNHDGGVDEAVEGIEVTGAAGVRLGDVGFAHGHTWAAPEVLAAPVVCVGHEHPTVRIEDEVGGARVERVWLRGDLDPTPFADRYDDPPADGELVVFPAYNDLSGGTWVNVEGQQFLSPFLPDAAPDAQAYLLDGTRLGRYDRV